MADSKFDLGDYVEVKDRIRLFYELYGQGRLETYRYELTREPDDKPKVIVEAAAYRTPEDQHPGRGLSWMYLPGSTSYTKGSELENTETSAWGRAIGALGILIDRSIASGNEIRAKAEEGEATTNGGLIGTAEKGTARTSDYSVRQSPDGPFLGFRLKDGRSKGGQIIEAWGAIAEALALIEPMVIGQRLQVWGHFVTRDLSKGGSYQAFVAEKIVGPEVVLPATDPAVGEPDVPRNAEVAGAGSLGADAPAAPDELEALPMFEDVA